MDGYWRKKTISRSQFLVRLCSILAKEAYIELSLQPKWRECDNGHVYVTCVSSELAAKALRCRDCIEHIYNIGSRELVSRYAEMYELGRVRDCLYAPIYTLCFSITPFDGGRMQIGSAVSHPLYAVNPMPIICLSRNGLHASCISFAAFFVRRQQKCWLPGFTKMYVFFVGNRISRQLELST